MLPPRSCRRNARGIGNAPNSGTRLTRGLSGCPDVPASRLPSNAGPGKPDLTPSESRLRPTISRCCRIASPSTAALPRDTTMLPPPWDSRWVGTIATPPGHDLVRRGSGRMPFPVTLRAASPPTPLPAPENASTALALGERCEPETSSRSHVQVAPSAHRLRRRPEAELSPHRESTLPTESARVASDPHRALEATECHGIPSPSPPACAVGAAPTQVPTRTEKDSGLGSEEPAPHHDADAQHSSRRDAPGQRIGSPMLPPTVTRHHRWVETTIEEACK
jgi:hypothetical protein